ncbi:NADH dehydrogenase subunit M [Paraoerskovia marina]|uniref:NADH dehydrogenase subunit M n=1 Tax=Paraoerskovia marina TaxID=545619 RepID=A0A1H1VGY1_9CELL|nr:NADH-quinone oxidoreductase subunit M [Paraoerskovia marina]SDS83945.1 NADH dehydrogenase subunit M [Paraoerskovia marina]
MTDFPWLTTLVLVPAVGALVVLALGRTAARSRVREVALAISLVEVGVLVGALTQFDTGQSQVHQLAETHAWIPQLGTSWALGADGVSMLLVALAVGLVPLVIGAAWRENLPTDGSKGLGHTGTYLVLILLLEAFMVTVFVARDVFLFYVVFEAMLIPVYFMIGGFGTGAQRRFAAVKFLIFSLAGGLIMLAAVIALYVNGPGGERGFLIDELTGYLAQNPMGTSTERLIFLGFFIAFAIKAPIVPVHTWLPDAAQAAPAGTSALLVGVLDKVGTFGMLALCLPLFPTASVWAAPVIVVLAVVSIIYGALLAIGQSDLMRLIAYTSVSHFGFIVLGIFSFTSLSISGSSLYMLNHGISTGALFLLAGFLIARHPERSQRIADYGGLQKVAPVLAGTFLVAGLSALSLPGLSTFVSEIMVLLGTFATSRSAALFAVVAVVLAALYVLLTYQRVFTGKVPDELAATPDLSGRERWVVAPLLAGLVVLGVYPAPALDMVREPAQTTMTAIGVVDAAPADDLATAGEGSDS